VTHLDTIVVTSCESPEDFVRQYHTHAGNSFDLEAMIPSYQEDFERFGLCWMDPHGSRLRRFTVWCPKGRDFAEKLIRDSIDRFGYLLPLEG